MRNEADRLHTWPPVDVALCGGYGRCTLMEEFYYWGWAVRAHNLAPARAYSASCLWLKCDLLVLCSMPAVCCLNSPAR